jgi:hypothetical protein
VYGFDAELKLSRVVLFRTNCGEQYPASWSSVFDQIESV